MYGMLNFFLVWRARGLGGGKEMEGKEKKKSSSKKEKQINSLIGTAGMPLPLP